MSSFPSQLAQILSSIDRPGKFYASGAAEIYLPSMEVEGVGPIAFPLLPFQAEQLIAAAEHAPYGKGEETLVDTEVRRTWQIGADKVHISGKYWPQNLGEIVDWVKDKLGVVGPVQAELYKLLVYDAGSFFVSHRDTEKAPGMFATLVIILPSIYQGGELLIRHQGQEARLEFHETGPSEVAFAAFFADCLHEVMPVTSGCRLTLIYNLIRTDKTQANLPPDYRDKQAQLTDWLRNWAAEAPDQPAKLIYPLEHAYTQAELSFSALKGTDAIRGSIAVQAARQAGCDVHLALITVEESGWAEYSGYSSRGRWYDEDEDDEFEVGEVTDSHQYLSHWRNPDDSQLPLDEFEFSDEELCQPGLFERLEPDELHFEEATGNEGASFERTYRRAALVFWPSHRRLAVLIQAGLFISLPYLEDLARRWIGSGEGTESPLWQEAHELSGLLADTWSEDAGYYDYRESTPRASATLLETLWRLRDTHQIEHFLTLVTAEGMYGISDNPSLVKAFSLLSPPRAVEWVETIMRGNLPKHLSACANLLALCTGEEWAGRPPSPLSAAAIHVVDALAAATHSERGTRPGGAIHRVVDLMAALERIDSALAETAAERLLKQPTEYGFDDVLIPALLTLAERQSGVGTERLRNACLAHLAQRIAEPLAPPADWTRPGAIACTCRNCKELSQFLANPGQKEWALKAAQAERSHVEESIRKARCDVDFNTLRRGSPHTLVCVKNDASYQRRVQQRRQDLEHQQTLRQFAS